MKDYKDKKLTYKDLKNISIDNLDMTTRTRNRLVSAGIENVAQLISLSQEELFRIRNLGDKSREELHKIIESFGSKEITSNMKKIDVYTIGMDEKEKKDYINNNLDIVLNLMPRDIGISSFISCQLERKGINKVLELVLSNETRLGNIVSVYDINDIKSTLSRFNLSIGMTKTEIDELISKKENTNYSNKEELYNIEGIISYLREQNNYLKEENEADKIILDYLQRLYKDCLGVEKLDDSEKQKIIELYDFVKENIVLKEENKKRKKDIKSYINNFANSSYIRDEKIKQKRKVKEDK